MIEKIEIEIRGMHCSDCAVQLEQAFSRHTGVRVMVSFLNEKALIEYDTDQITLSRLIHIIEKNGFTVPAQNIQLSIEGMSCVTCSQTIEKTLNSLKGVNLATVNFASSTASIQFNPHQISVVQLIKAVEGAGYRASVKDHFSASTLSNLNQWKNQGDFRAFLHSALLTLPFILQMIGDVLGYHAHIPLWIQVLLASVVQFWSGWRFYKGSYHALRVGSGNMDLLITLGTSAAYFYSLAVAAYRLPGPVYFESSTIIITLILLGRWLESQSKAKASAAIEKLMQLQPKTSHVERKGKVIELPIAEIVPQDIFVVRPGENIPVDGVVIEGNSSINESMLTGESIPVSKMIGSKVYAGTTNHQGVLRVRALQVGSKTFLASIIRLVEKAQNSKAPIQRLADSVSAIFVPVVLVVSVVTLLGWLLLGASLSEAIVPMIAVLVIACPCALGLATPTVIMVASGRAANLGIIFKEAATLEKTEKIQVVIFDKTGTLTEGKPQVKGLIPAHNTSENELIQIAAALENNSQHPLAKAIVDYAHKKGVPLEPVVNFESFSGKGVVAEKRGKQYFLGSLAFAKEKGIQIPNKLVEPLEQKGNSIVAVWQGREILGIIAVADQIRESASKAISQLHSMGIHTIMITGDNEETASVIAEIAGIQEYWANVLPENKVRHIADLKSKKKIVGMVGDGINDAPALASADIGFSLGASSDIALEASDVTLVRNDLTDVPQAIALSKATMKKIKQNLFFAFIYNILGIPLAALGLLNPVIAAAAMALSSISVVGNALLMRHWNKKP